MYSQEKLDSKIGALDWGIIFSILILFLIIYIPRSIWIEETEIRNNARQRMLDISNSQDFYFELTGKYSTNGEHLFELVEAAMDSLIADSTFTGSQLLNLSDGKYAINIERGFEVKVDTTFSDAVIMRKVKLDTIYTVGMKNEDSGGVDTLFVNVRDLKSFTSDEMFHEIFSTDTTSRTEIVTDYLRKKYHLSNDQLYCPITNEKFYFDIDESDLDNPIFTVSSPVPDDYTESRFLVFQFEAGRHGSVKGGVTTWAGE